MIDAADHLAREFARLRSRWNLYRWLAPAPASAAREKARFLDAVRGRARPSPPRYEYPAHDPAELAADRAWLDSAVPPPGPLGELLAEERRFLLHQLDMVAARGDAERFTALSIEAFEKPDAGDLAAARDGIARPRPCLGDEPITPGRLADEACEHLRALGIGTWSVAVIDGLSTIMKVDSGHRRIELRGDFTFAPVDRVSLLHHEIEGHVVRAENGFAFGHEFLGLGVGYETELDEGLAVWFEEKHGGLGGRRWEELTVRVLAVDAALAGGFLDVWDLVRDLAPGIGEDLAYQLALRVKRGLADTAAPGGWTKDALYFRGWRRVSEWVAAHGEEALRRELMAARVSWEGVAHVRGLTA
jgi:hypothetical protein